MTEKKIAHKRFAAYQELIWKYVPRSNPQTTIANELLKGFTFLGPDLQIVLQYDGLRVEVEVSIGRIPLQ
jgi:hypothetical protein